MAKNKHVENVEIAGKVFILLAAVTGFVASIYMYNKEFYGD